MDKYFVLYLYSEELWKRYDKLLCFLVNIAVGDFGYDILSEVFVNGWGEDFISVVFCRR